MTTYTVWSRGRELGYSTLASARRFENKRVGWFFPSDEGMALMPAITGLREALLNLLVATKGEPEGDPEDFTTAAYAKVEAADHEERALQLELRGPDGRVIPTADIEIRDTELFIPEIHGGPDDDAPLPELAEEQQAVVDEMVAYCESLPQQEPWSPGPEPDTERFRLTVTLHNKWDIP